MSMGVNRLSSLVEADLKAHNCVTPVDRNAIFQEAFVDGIDVGELVSARRLLASSKLGMDLAQAAVAHAKDVVEADTAEVVLDGPRPQQQKWLADDVATLNQKEAELDVATKRLDAYTKIEATFTEHATLPTRFLANATISTEDAAHGIFNRAKRIPDIFR